MTEDVHLRSIDEIFEVNAKSFINLYCLDLAKPIYIVTDSQFVLDELEKIGLTS